MTMLEASCTSGGGVDKISWSQARPKGCHLDYALLTGGPKGPQWRQQKVLMVDAALAGDGANKRRCLFSLQFFLIISSIICNFLDFLVHSFIYTIFGILNSKILFSLTYTFYE